VKRLLVLAALAGALALAGCNEPKTAAAPPPPATLTASAIGHYCGMNVLEHAGPKGQIILASRPEPIWFSSARDALAFTMLPEEPKDIRAIYLSDMAKAPSWDEPGEANWTDARSASFVIGSRRKSGMGADEAVPFSGRAAAEAFVRDNGGRVVAFAEIPRDYVLSAGGEATGAVAEEPGPHGAHETPAAAEAPAPAPAPQGGHQH
jgi:copper chaperone NosL